MSRSLSTLRAFAGAAAVVVPSGIVVHLVAEAIALGSAAASPVFWLRHLYLIVPLGLALWSFVRTVGLGMRRAEMVRRCALLRGRMHAGGGGAAVASFAFANVAFFAITQLLEGDPIASASLVAGIVAAIAGSLLAALVVYSFGRSIVAVALAAVVRRPRGPFRVAFARRLGVGAARTAASAFSLFVPNRPPPSLSLT